jgi:hypothetical protein
MADFVDGGAAVKVAVYAALMYDIISATNSSPQTTEINAASRGPTLMKWVHLGMAQGVLFVGVGVALDKQRWPPLLGGGLAAVLLYVQYVHARNAGLQNPGPSTETTGGSSNGDGGWRIVGVS